jgi:hypothetical protein
MSDIHTACTKMIGAVSNDHNGFGNARMERNSRYSSFDHTRNPTPVSVSQSVTLQRENGDSEHKAFCVLYFAKHESVVSVQRAFRRQFQSELPSSNNIRR